MIEDAGFLKVEYQNLGSGIVAIHSGFKLWFPYWCVFKKKEFEDDFLMAGLLKPLGTSDQYFPYEKEFNASEESISLKRLGLKLLLVKE